LLILAGKKLRNPSTKTLEEELARAGLIDGGLIHDERSRRFIRRMRPRDAYVAYTLQGGRMVLTHIEVDASRRHEGIGARLAEEVLAELSESDKDIRITCTFLRRIAFAQPRWRERFKVTSAF